MTAIKHTLQRDVFLPNDERLMGLVHVTQAGKKKKGSKMSFLCAARKLGFSQVPHCEAERQIRWGFEDNSGTIVTWANPDAHKPRR